MTLASLSGRERGGATRTGTNTTEAIDMRRIHKLKVPLYPITFFYCSESKPLEIKYDLERAVDDVGGYCWSPHDNLEVAMYLPHQNGTVIIGDLAHEAFHVAMRIAGKMNIQVHPGNNEPVAYLISWICDKVLDIVKKEHDNESK